MMKKTRHLILFLCMICMAAVVSLSAAAAEKASLTLNKSKLTLYVGDTATLKPTVTGKSSKVTWKSSSKSVATVSGGKITAKKAGKATITAKANGKTKRCVVTVKKVPGYVKAYKKLLSQRSVNWDNTTLELKTSKMEFALAYIDNNSVPELIIDTGGQTPHAVGWGLLYTYRNNKLTYVGTLELNNTLYYYKKKGIILDNYTGGGATADTYRLLKNGRIYNKLQRNGYYNYATWEIDRYEYYDSSSSRMKSISKSKFNSKLKKLVGSKKAAAVKLYENNKANRSKYIK